MTLDRLVNRAIEAFSLTNLLAPLLPHAPRHEILRRTITGGDDPAKVVNACVAYSRSSVMANTVVGAASLLASPFFLPAPVGFEMLGVGLYTMVDAAYRSWSLRNGVPSENLIGMGDDERYGVDEQIRGTLVLDLPYRIITGKLNPLDIIRGPYQHFTRRHTPELFTEGSLPSQKSQ